MPRPSIRIFRFPARVSRKTRRARLITMFVAFLVLVTFITPFYIIYKPPSLLIRFLQYRWPDVLFHVDIKEKVMALTIDDAPSHYTSEILQILKENDAKATFFIIGSQVRGREDTLKQIVLEGMELGNHAMHDAPSRALSPSDLAAEIQAVEAMIDEAYTSTNYPKPPRYFRPGSGFFSDKMRKLLAEMSYRLVLGDIYPHDPQIPYWRVNAKHVLSMIRPGGIIICHDRRSWTMPMLRKVIPELKNKGWRITTVSGLLEQAYREKRAGT